MRDSSRLALLGSLALAWACSLSSLDDLKRNAGAPKDAGFDGPVEGGKCEHGVDCGGCADCTAWCGCVAPGVVQKCIADCTSASGGAGGAPAGGGGSGGSIGGSGGVPGGGGAGAGNTGGASSGGGPPGGGGTGGAGAGGGGTGGNVAGQALCGTTPCAINDHQCCVENGGTTCQALTSVCTGTSITCDGPEDCSMGQVCCGTLSSASTVYDSVVCATACSQSQNQRMACDPNLAAGCPSGMTCKPSTLLTGYYFCN